MFYYTYKIQFVDGYYYYGSRKSNIEPSNDKYYGSPRRHKDKWQTTMFEKLIVEEYTSYKDMRVAENELIGDNYKTDPLCLNAHNIKNGRVCVSHTEETKNKIKEKAKSRKPISDETRAKLKNSSKGATSLTEDGRRRIKEARAKQVFSDETRKKMSESAKKRKPISEETREKLRQASINARRNKKWSTSRKLSD